MNYTISDKMRTLQPSAIREFFKTAADPSIIQMTAGSPAPETLPTAEIRRIMAEIMEHDLEAALVYSQSEGHPPLRQALKERAAAEGNFTDNDDLMVVSGAQQCMDISVKVLCNEGDTVLAEDPSFAGNLNAIRSYGTNLVGIPMQEDGIDVERLEQALKTEKNVRMIYVIPNYQNPTGITMSAEKRVRCYELAKQYGVMIFEDNPYGELRFAGEPLPTIKSMDTEGLVIYAGTFSKILSPGIRTGYLIAPHELFGKMVVAKQCVDVHSSMLAQLLCYRFLTEFDLPAHIRQLSAVYKRKCRLMLEELDNISSEKIRFTRPDGGLFVWCTLAGVEDSAEFMNRLVAEKKVAGVPGSTFATTQNQPSPCFRVTFATPTEEQIVAGIGGIADMLGQ